MKNLININSELIRKYFPMNIAIPAMKKAFQIISEGTATVSEKIYLELPEVGGRTITIPVYVPELKLIGAKFISIYPDNFISGYPTIHAVILIIDAENGSPLAIMDGAELTAIRTGAASGVATDLLAVSDADCVAIFGAGIQGRTQLEGVCAVRPITHALIYDTLRNNALDFKHQMETKLGINIEIGHPDQLQKAQIICTASSSKEPVFNHQSIAKGTHINAVGSYKPDVQEIPNETVKSSKIFVDKLSSALEEARDIIIPLQQNIITLHDILGEIGDIVTGKLAGRENADDITLFESVGNAVQDLVAAAEILKHYR